MRWGRGVDSGPPNTGVQALDTAILGNVDLLLLHWPCATIEQTVAAYSELEAALAAGAWCHAMSEMWPARSVYLFHHRSTVPYPPW